jgi:mRNA deadenylase 3'-5' endonuclease subunit Ccr4
VRIVQYNLLCPNLANKKTYPLNHEHDLDANVRRERILEDKIFPHISENAIFCLQEFPPSWVGPFHTFFSKYNYHMVYGNYGFHMGVLLAYPYDHYTAIDTKLIHVGSTLEVPRITKPNFIWAWILSLLMFLSATFKKYYEKKTFDPLIYVSKRQNLLILCKLKHEDTNTIVNVATYHMPCAFWAPKVMDIHLHQAIKLAQEFDDCDYRLVFAGDFNILPTSTQYQNVLSGNEILYPMESAYTNHKPTYHSYTSIGNKYFTDTLDYIFYNGNLKVMHTGYLPTMQPNSDPLPNKDEPSDHLLLYADFELHEF